MSTLSDVRKMEESIFALLEKARNDICEEIRNTPVPGVTKLNDFCFTVPLSVIGTGPWTAEYYSPTSQANLVDRVLASAQTATSSHEKIARMLEKKQVKLDGCTYPLNDVTLGILAKADT